MSDSAASETRPGMSTPDETRLTVNGVALHVRRAGPEDGPLVILLHGFPEHGRSWARQMDALARAGFRVWAPDQRGYDQSGKPEGLAAYHLDRLAGDVTGLIDAAGRDRATVVGHDWGGLVAWWVAIRHRARVEKLIVLNMPHPTALFTDHLRYSLHRCWYFYFFMVPRLPERALALANWTVTARAVRSNARRGTFTEADLDELRQAWARPGAMTAMVNWYRALMRLPLDLADVRVRVPTLIIWGARDSYLGRRLASASRDQCDEGRLVFLEEATHWLHHEEPDRVNGLMESFLRDAGRRAVAGGR